MATEIASTQDLAIGEMMGVEKDGTSLLVANVDGSFYAINNICTHMGGTVKDFSHICLTW